MVSYCQVILLLLIQTLKSHKLVLDVRPQVLDNVPVPWWYESLGMEDKIPLQEAVLMSCKELGELNCVLSITFINT